MSDEDDEEADPNIDNIAGTNKVTRSGRIFCPEISLKNVATSIQVTVTKSTAEARGR